MLRGGITVERLAKERVTFGVAFMRFEDRSEILGELKFNDRGNEGKDADRRVR